MNDDQRSFTPHPPDSAGVVTWVHIGDLHMTAAGEQNHLDLQAIVTEVNPLLNDIAFTFVPGDIADKGSAEQYQAVRGVLDTLAGPWCAIVGDHDVHEESFDNFLHFMSKKTHYDFTVGDIRFFALNAFERPHPASFAVLADQLAWLEDGLTSLQPNQSAVLLLHCYPSDLKQGRQEVEALVKTHSVRLIDMGHTHYNEIANDGRLLYTATRSTGQIEEGPAGFSLTNIDGPVISWKFFPLGALPAVMITSPADERLIPESQAGDLILGGGFRVRAKAFSSADIHSVVAHLEEASFSLVRIAGSQVWETVVPAGTLRDGIHTLSVTLSDAEGHEAKDTIRIVMGQSAYHPPARKQRDQDNAIEAWPERGLLGTQLGPNKNGKKW